MHHRATWIVGLSVTLIACGGGRATGSSSASSGGAGTSGGGQGGGASGSGGSSSSGGGAGGQAPAPIPVHVPSWAYVGGNYGFLPTPDVVQRYIDFAEAMHDAEAKATCPPTQTGCVPVFYVSFGYLGIPDAAGCPDPPQTTFFDQAAESGLLHFATPVGSSNRISKVDSHTYCNDGAHIFYPNLADHDARAWWWDYVSTTLADQPNAVIFEDNFPTTLEGMISGTGHLTSVELADDHAMRAAQAGYLDGLAPRQVFTNSLAGGGYDAGVIVRSTETADLVTAGNFQGFVAEKPLYSNATDPASAYFTMELSHGMLNTAAHMAHQQGDPRFVVLHFAPSETTRQDEAQHVRRVHTSLVWLSYVPGRTVSWEGSTPTDSTTLGFFPEELVVPTEPLQTMRDFVYGGSGDGSGCPMGSGSDSGGARDLAVACGVSFNAQQPEGVYRREFARCGFEGVEFGPCATVMNATRDDVALDPSWFTKSFGHTIAMHGRELAEIGCPTCDGSIDFDTAPLPAGAVVPANDALLLVP
jgi:hypothetical protein